jgi:hypothetical protein
MIAMALHQALHSFVNPESPPGARIAEGDAEAVEVYRRTYLTLLRSSGETRLRVLEATHRAMRSSLHPLASSPEPDLGAFLYSSRRLPDSIGRAQLIVMGQSTEVFRRRGFVFDAAHAPGHLHRAALADHAGEHLVTGAVETPAWRAVEAPGRRRRWYHDDAGTLAVLIASASDIDDLIPTLVAFQIEWNKLGVRLRAQGVGRGTAPPPPEQCAALLGGSAEDWTQLAEMWGDGFARKLAAIAGRRMSLRMRMLGGSQVGYARVTRRWWEPVHRLLVDEGLEERPVYFVSSNPHSIANLVSGVAQDREAEIVAWVDAQGPKELRDELRRFREGRAQGDWANFVYYAARQWMRSVGKESEEQVRRRDTERRVGVFHVNSTTALHVSAQVIALERLDPARLDARLLPVDAAALRASRGVVVNIDYPLGLAAYNILREVAETVGELRGVYVLGKAATLNADVGDVMLSTVVHDEHSGSTFWLDNAFSLDDISPFLRFGSGLDNQRTVTVKGTFLQNRGYLDFYYREQFTVVEMEAGPYCTAVYEMNNAERYPVGEPVNFSKLPVDLGIIHYASDTPYTQARTLGARGLSYFGMDSTYASSVAILRRVLSLEGAAAPGPVAAQRRDAAT